jgi:hypothetical protein
MGRCHNQRITKKLEIEILIEGMPRKKGAIKSAGLIAPSEKVNLEFYSSTVITCLSVAPFDYSLF